jgi:hypothetical protein
MGGPGSGLWHRWDKRLTLDAVKQLDIRWLHRYGYLTAYPRWVTWYQGERQTGMIGLSLQPFGVELEYSYRSGKDWKPVRQVIMLNETPCHYGGARQWFLCPSCERRVAILYYHGTAFLCRHCCRLPYSSQCESPLDRAYRKTRKIRDRLEVSGNLLDPVMPWKKPKHMHWRTFLRLCEQERDAHHMILEHMCISLERWQRR